jgi:hypothetical protein
LKLFRRRQSGNGRKCIKCAGSDGNFELGGLAVERAAFLLGHVVWEVGRHNAYQV